MSSSHRSMTDEDTENVVPTRARGFADEGPTTTVTMPAWSPVQILGLIVGIGFAVLGLAAIVRTGFDTSHIYRPHEVVWQLPHSPLLALIEIAFGALLIVASVLPGGIRSLIGLLGAANVLAVDAASYALFIAFLMRLRIPPAAASDEVVRDAVRRHNPTVFRGKVLKIYYATQTQVNPPTFVFFVNDPQALHFSYERYLENQLREAFGFKGTAIRLFFRARPKSEQTR